MTSFPPDAEYEKGLLATDFGKQFSVAIPGSQEPGFSAIYKNAKYPEVQLGTDEFKTLTAYDVFARGLARSASGPCLGHRPYDPVTKTWDPYVWQTYEQVARRRDAIGAGIVKLHEKVAIRRFLSLLSLLADMISRVTAESQVNTQLPSLQRTDQNGQSRILLALHNLSYRSLCTTPSAQTQQNSS